MNDAPSKRPLISLPFLAIVGVLALGAYFAGPSVMQWVMLQQEKAKQGGGPSGPEEFAGLSELAKSLKAGGDTGDAAAVMAGADEASSAGGGGGNRPDPETRFTEADADGNGKLEGDEISERMQGRLSDVDTDGDGAVSKEEYMTMVESFRNGGGNRATPPSGDAPAGGGGGAGGSDS